MARKSLVVLVTAAAAAGIVATGAAAGAALTGDGPRDGFGPVASSSPSDDFTPPSDDSTPSDDPTTPSDDPTSTAPAVGAVSRERAIDIALATTGGGTVVDTEAEWEHGRPAWKIEIVKGGIEHKVYVDRETGGIVKFDADDRGGSGSGRGGDDDPAGDDHGGSGSGKGRGGHDD